MMRNGADALVDALVRCGVDTMFGFPGDTSVALYDVLARQGGGIRHVLARDERHTGFMADAYARTRRRIAVCEASSGAGAVYLASGLGESFASSIPVLAVATDNNRRSRGTAAISEVDQDRLFAAVTKWRRTVSAAADIPRLVAEAITAATAGRPGPAVLIIPEDVLEAPVGTPAPASGGAAPGGEVPAVIPGQREAAPDDAVAVAAGQIAAATWPAVVAGGGVHLSGAWSELRLLAEHAALPVATTIHGKGAIDDAHPLALGVIGSNGARGYANQWLAGADLVLFAGTRANATDTLGFTVPARSGPRVIHIDADSSRAGRNYPGSLPLAGDAATVLGQLRARLPAAPAELSASRAAELAAARADWAREDAALDRRTPPGVLHPRAVIAALHDGHGPDTWVVADAGTPTPYLSCYWRTSGGGWRVVIPRGHGPMGFAIPASIGVAVAHPGERVLCLTTENSVMMAVGEWETACRLGLPVTYVVLDNRSLSWIKMIQHLYLDRRYFAVDPGPVDPVRLGAAVGVAAARARDVAELTSLAKEAAERGGPSVIHVKVPEHMDSPPPVAPWLDALSGTAASRPIH
jgi:acetolactate synthase I/II/III large subunit